MKIPPTHIPCLAACLLACWLAACTPAPRDVVDVDEPAPIYPDYADVTIPRNIAPLNFLLRGDYDACRTVVRGTADSLVATGTDDAVFDIKGWRRLLADNDTLTVTVTARSDGRWLRFRPFGWRVVADSLDRYLSYRLIEPGYEVFGHIQLCERDLEGYDERVIVDNLRDNTGCFNCHIYGPNGETMYHRRGPGGGTMVNRDGHTECLALRIDTLASPAIYGDWHPSGRYAIFSSNVIIPMMHSLGNRRLEVYDTISDVFAVRFGGDAGGDALASPGKPMSPGKPTPGDAKASPQTYITSPLLSRKDRLETFPTFSADGTKAYFCTAPVVVLPDSVRSLRYSLVSIDFDAKRGAFGTRIDTLWSAWEHGASVCHPKASPDGRWLMYTVADYGTFPIWHTETALRMLDLRTGEELPLDALDSDRSDTYHSWSRNSRWVVFASKRGDGQYGRPYFAHIAPDGTPSKPFVLPQRDPRLYDRQLQSYNIPDLSPTPSHF